MQKLSTVFVVLVLAGCSGLRPGYETPTVTLSSFRALPSEGVLPSFEIGLHIVNPNRESLALEGLSYTVSLEGHELIKGVANELPVIEGYGEGDIVLTGTANLFSGIRLITELLNERREVFRYAFEAKLDLGAFRPAIRVRESGEISLPPAARAPR